MFEFSKLPLEIQLKILIRLNFEDQDNFIENLEGYYKEFEKEIDKLTEQFSKLPVEKKPVKTETQNSLITES